MLGIRATRSLELRRLHSQHPQSCHHGASRCSNSCSRQIRPFSREYLLNSFWTHWSPCVNVVASRVTNMTSHRLVLVYLSTMSAKIGRFLLRLRDTSRWWCGRSRESAPGPGTSVLCSYATHMTRPKNSGWVKYSEPVFIQYIITRLMYINKH
jgi:hypothetical protein